MLAKFCNWRNCHSTLVHVHIDRLGVAHVHVEGNLLTGVVSGRRVSHFSGTDTRCEYTSLITWRDPPTCACR